MNVFNLSNIRDIYNLKSIDEKFSKVRISTIKLKYRGVLRHAFFYAYKSLDKGGEIEIQDEPFKNYSAQRDNIDFWQVKYEFFRSMRDKGKVLELDNSKGLIRWQIGEAPISYPAGISFGIVFSGTESDEVLLNEAIRSINENVFLQGIQHEILVCGPSNFHSERLTKKFPSVQYLPFDVPTTPRLLICEKKNLIYNACRYEKVSISHTRIIFARDFAEKFWELYLEVASPIVFLKKDGSKYLDYTLTDNYEDALRKQSKQRIGYKWIDENYLYYMTKRVPWIDGGITLFNKNCIDKAPFNPFIAWGEAEDMEMCSRLYYNGYLLDFFPELVCFSQTDKIHQKYEGFKRPIRNFVKKLWISSGH
jgi:hypothetical protein